MTDTRTLLAAVLSLLLGAVCLLAPAAVVRVQTAGRRPTGRDGEYGTDAVPDRWRRLVQVIGGGLVVAAAYFGYVALGLG
jgi:hypothetical protein